MTAFGVHKNHRQRDKQNGQLEMDQAGQQTGNEIVLMNWALNMHEQQQHGKVS